MILILKEACIMAMQSTIKKLSYVLIKLVNYVVVILNISSSSKQTFELCFLEAQNNFGQISMHVIVSAVSFRDVALVTFYVGTTGGCKSIIHRKIILLELLPQSQFFCTLERNNKNLKKRTFYMSLNLLCLSKCNILQ